MSPCPITRSRHRWTSITALLALVASLFALAAAPAPAGAAITCDTSWDVAADGDWNTAANWSSGVPTISTAACIDIVGVTVTASLNPDAAALLVGPDATLRVESTALDIATGGQVDNAGTIIFDTADARFPEVVITNTGLLRTVQAPEASDTVELQNWASFDNQGQIELLAPTRFGRFSGSTTSTGDIIVGEDTVVIDFPNVTLEAAGALTIGAGAVLQYGGTFTVSGTVFNAGTLDGTVANVRLLLDGLSYGGAGTVLLSGSKLEVTGPFTGPMSMQLHNSISVTGHLQANMSLSVEEADGQGAAVLTFETPSATTAADITFRTTDITSPWQTRLVSNRDAVTVGGQIAGHVINTGTITFLAGTETAPHVIDALVENQGTLTFGTDADITREWGIVNSGALTVAPTATVALLGRSDTSNTGIFDLQGTWIQGSNDGVGINVFEQTGDGVITGNGTLNLYSTDLVGDGPIAADVSIEDHDSTLAPGPSTAAFAIDGALTLADDAADPFRGIFELAGPEPGTGYDQAAATGALTINGGALDVQRAVDIAGLHTCQEFDILPAASRTGEFASETMPANQDVSGSAHAFRSAYHVQGLTIVAYDTTLPVSHWAGDGLAVAESGATSDTYVVCLRDQPTGDVTITPTVQNGQVTVSPASVTFTSTDWELPKTFTVTAVDDELDEVDPHSDTITHDVTGLTAAVPDLPVSIADDDATPVAQDQSVTTAEDTPIDITLTATDADTAEPTLVYSIESTPANGTLTKKLDGNVWNYEPAADFNGTDQFTFTATDDGPNTSNVATVTITVNPVNDPPIAVADSATTSENNAVTVPVLVNDRDVDGDPLTVSAVTQPSNGTVTSNGTNVTYSPNANFVGNDLFTYTASDGNGGTDTATVTVDVGGVNDPPAATDDAGTVGEDDSVLLDVLANDTDPDGDILAIDSITQPASGSTTIESGQVRYTPDANFHGTDSFTYVATDGELTDSATVTITVNSVNDAPVATDDAANTDEDTSVLIDVLDGDTDVDGDTLAIASVTQPTSGATAIEAGQVRYTPDADYFGTDSFTYTVSDGNGGSDTATVSVTVNSVNDAPVATDDAATTDEDTSVLIGVLGNDTDVDGDTLTIDSVTTQPVSGTAEIEAGKIRYTPDPDYFGNDNFTYTVSDGNGGSDTATVTITVNSVNDAPVATDDSGSTEKDTSVLIDVLANDTDVDGDTLTIASITQPANGTTAIEAGEIRYTPNTGHVGSDSFTYTVSDGSLQDTATVNVSVGNLAPVATDDAASVTENGSTSVAVLANDSDPEGDTLTVTSVTTPTLGTVTHNGTTVSYTSTGGTGTDTFGYTISDGNGGTDSATVTVTVNPAPTGGGGGGGDTTSETEASGTTEDGGTLSTDGDTATAANPVIVSVTTPNGGNVTISEGDTTMEEPSGYRLFQQEVTITAPAGSVDQPLTIELRFHESVVPANNERGLRIFRNGKPIARACVGPAGVADPDPCVVSIEKVGEEWVITILTSRASTWNGAVVTEAVIDRLAGDTRIGTAVAVAKATWEQAGTVVLARADEYADALAGAPLAASVGGPMLLTNGDELHDLVAAEISRLGANEVVLLGGAAALSPRVEATLVESGLEVTRIGGTDRFDTARLVALEVDGDVVYVTEGLHDDPERGWPDAVSVSGLAARERRPILLVTRDTVPSATQAALEQLAVTHAAVVGGSAAVSDTVYEAIEVQTGSAERLAGIDRYATSQAVAQRAISVGMEPRVSWFATGDAFPDALVAGPAAARDGGVLLLAPGTSTDASAPVADWLEQYGSSLQRGVLVGGSAALTSTFEDGVRASAG